MKYLAILAALVLSGCASQTGPPPDPHAWIDFGTVTKVDVQQASSLGMTHVIVTTTKGVFIRSGMYNGGIPVAGAPAELRDDRRILRIQGIDMSDGDGF